MIEIFFLFECTDAGRNKFSIGDVVVRAQSTTQCLKHFALQLRKEFAKQNPEITQTSVSVECSYVDPADGLNYTKGYTLSSEFEDEEQAVACKQEHHVDLPTIYLS